MSVAVGQTVSLLISIAEINSPCALNSKRFLVGVLLFSNRSYMTLKYGNNKNLAHTVKGKACYANHLIFITD